MSETTEQQPGQRALVEQSQISVLYVALETVDESTPVVLEETTGIDVHVTTSPPALSGEIVDEFDCLVVESDGTDATESLVADATDRSPEMQVVVYAHPADSTETYRDYIEEGVVEYLPRAADTDDRLLLTRRIEGCIELERERTATENHQAAIDRMGHGVLIADPDGRIEYVNRTFEALGYSPEDLEGEPLSALRSESGERATYRDFWETVTDGEPWTGELTVETPGDERIVDLTATQLRGKDGAVQRIVIVGDDVTERRQRERRLRSLQEAVEQAGHVIMVTDTEGHIEYANPAFEEVTGYGREEVLGERPSVLKSGEHDDSFYRELWETIGSGEVWEGEMVNERKSGERYHIRQTIAPVTDDEGEIEQYVAINTDITDRKRYERQIERERNRLEEFAQTVAHDLRNPLSIALGSVDVVRDRRDGSAESLECAFDALKRMDALIDELLTLSKQGQTIHQPEPVRPARVAKRAWETVETPGAALTIDGCLDGWSLEADDSRLCELFENLFRNAVEHGSTGAPSGDGEPEVSVRVGCLDGRRGFFVADDGPGIPADDRNQVFAGGFTTADDGTGFGLSIVAQIVEAHGWEIDIAASRDGGARFEIRTGGESGASGEGGALS